MTSAHGAIDSSLTVGEVDARLYGTLVEHLGRCVYTGIHEPAHPESDERGFRLDVLELARELGVTIVRYPGGNFVSGYRWEDGVGPVDERPVRLDLAWRSVEHNRVGTDEFVDWVRLVGAEPMLAVNLGTRGTEAALDLLEYCNVPGGTALSARRAANGHPEPHAVSVWCLGNEVDGPWQIGQKTAEDYSKLARETAKAMKILDPSVELVACGSSSRAMPTFGEWEATVLEQCYPYVDFISAHAYYEPEDDDLDSFLASACDMDAYIDGLVATCDHVAAKLRSPRRIDVSFDEWNVWYQSRLDATVMGSWQEHPRLIEDTYSLADAVVVGTLLITLLQHADRVRIACLAQLVNAIAPIMTQPGGPAWRQTTFFPFALAARHARSGVVLRLHADGPRIETQRFGSVPALEATAVWREAEGELVILCANRDRRTPLELDLALHGFDALGVVEHVTLTGDNPYAQNTCAQPNTVRPQQLTSASVNGGRLTAPLPPLSWNLIRLCSLGARRGQHSTAAKTFAGGRPA